MATAQGRGNKPGNHPNIYTIRQHPLGRHRQWRPGWQSGHDRHQLIVTD
jgi:hypothetical protein